MRNRSSVADTAGDERSLYDVIVELTGIEFDQKIFSGAGGAEEYKNKLVRHFGDLDGDDFDSLPDDVRDWANEATEVFNDNRRAKERSPLPVIDGMPEFKPRTRVTITENRRTRVVAAPPEPPEPEEEPEPEPEEEVAEEPPEEEAEAEEEPTPPPRAARTRSPRPEPAKPARPAPAARPGRRDPDSGRYARVMPHYLKHREVEVPELQKMIAKSDGARYSETTLDRTLAACRSVVGWLERQGVNLDRLSK